MTQSDCAKAAASLMAGYVGITVNLPESDKAALLRAFERIFAVYPRFAAVEVCDPAKGLPSRLQFIPKPADLVAALEAVVGNRRAYAIRAQWHKDEHLRRKKESDIDASRNKSTAAERAAFADKAMAKFKPMNDESEAA